MNSKIFNRGAPLQRTPINLVIKTGRRVFVCNTEKLHILIDSISSAKGYTNVKWSPNQLVNLTILIGLDIRIYTELHHRQRFLPFVYTLPEIMHS